MAVAPLTPPAAGTAPGNPNMKLSPARGDLGNTWWVPLKSAAILALA